MTSYEYKVTPAPQLKGRAAKRADQVARVLEASLNDQAKDGWHYVRMDVVRVETKRWLRRAKTETQSVVVFRRALAPAMPQLVLRPDDAVKMQEQAPDRAAEEALDQSAEPPRIENAVRGFARRPVPATTPLAPKERAPLVAARRV